MLSLLVASWVAETPLSLRDKLGDRAGKNPELTNNGRRSWEPIVTGRMPPEEDLEVGLAGLFPAALALSILFSSCDDTEPPCELREDRSAAVEAGIFASDCTGAEGGDEAAIEGGDS